MLQNTLKFAGPIFRSLAPGIPLRNFGMKTTQAGFIQKPVPLPQYSRNIIRDLNTKPTPEQQRIIDEEKRVQETLRKIYETKQNDKNPANFVKVKVNFVGGNKTEEVQPSVIENLAQPYTLLVQPKAPKVIFHGRRKKVPCSLKKLLPLMRAINGKHIYDAINMCVQSRKKAARYIARTLQRVRKHGIDKSLNEERFYVHSTMTGRNRRYLRVRYHAKGKGAMMKKDTSQLLIRLEERPIEQMYKDMMVGRTPPMLAFILRKRLLEKGVDYDILRKNTNLLTAKGRQQRRLMFKRRVIQQRLAFKEKGIDLSKKIIAQKILEEEAQVFGESYRRIKEQEITKTYSDRMALFKRNQEASGF